MLTHLTDSGSSKLRLSALAAAVACTVLLSACGGGDDDGLPAGTQALSVTVMDGLVSKAKVCWDANNNGACDINEMTARTNAQGVATFSLPANTPPAAIVAEVGTDATDADTGAVVTAYVMSAPAGQAVVSPLTTLAHQKMKTEGKTLAQAEQAVKTDLGLATKVSVFDNYVEHRSADSDYKKASVLARATVLASAAASGNWSEAESKVKTELGKLDDQESENDDSGLRTSCYATNTGALSSDCDSKLAGVVGGGSGTSPAPTPTPTPTPSASVTAGQALYASSCAMCHTSNPAINASSVLKAKSASSLLSAIASNKGGMGMLSTTIKSAEATSIAAYLGTF